MMWLFKAGLYISFLWGVHLSYVGPTVQTFIVCEGQTKMATCYGGTLISIIEGIYGVPKDNPSCFSDSIVEDPAQDCYADSNFTKNVLMDRCQKKSSCTVVANDTLFELIKVQGCGNLDTHQSQLVFKWQCKPLSSWSTIPVTSPTTSAAATRVSLDVIYEGTTNVASNVPVPTTRETNSPTSTSDDCFQGQLKKHNCYNWACTDGFWQRQSMDKTDPSCCTLWNGCDLSNVEMVTSQLILENSNSSAEPRSYTDIRSQPTENDNIIGYGTAVEKISGTSIISSVPSTTEFLLPGSVSRNGTISSIRSLRTESQNQTIFAIFTNTVGGTRGLSSSTESTKFRESSSFTTFKLLLKKILVPECPQTESVLPYKLVWPTTMANTMMTLPCPNDTRLIPSRIRRKCSETGEWSDHIDAKLCPSSQILSLVNKNLGEEDLLEFTSELAEVSNRTGLSSGDISAVASLITETSRAIKNSSPGDVVNITKNVLITGGNILSGRNALLWKDVDDSQKTSKAMEVVLAVENLALQTANGISSDLELKTNKIELNVKLITKEEISANTTVAIGASGVSVSFPAENIVSAESGKLVTIIFDRDDVWAKQENEVLNTKVFSASLVDMNKPSGKRSLSSPFQYRLDHKATAETQLHKCVFWDESSENSRWSTSGCKKIDGTKDYTVCECDHLTNFAVLLDVSGASDKISEEHVLSLQIITYAGCIISIVCLLLSWLTFQFLKNLSSDRNTIHKNLVLMLMLAESIFLSAISPQVTSYKVLCSVIAGFLHYLFLAVFAWTCLEGVQLYIMLIEVFEAERSRTLYYYLAGYGIPAIVVGISAAIDHTGYGTPSVCWLRTDTGFIWSFAGPVAAVLLVNMAMLGIALYMMYNHAKMVANMKHKETTRIDSIRAWVKGAIVLVILLGLTWVFGFLYINNDTLVMAYLFTILNSLQGLFVFVFHCVGNEKVQKEYKKLVRRTQWLPKCLRVHYGEHKGLSYTTSHSTGSQNYLSKYFVRRKSSDLMSTLKGKKSVGPNNSSNSNGNSSYDDSTMGKEPLHNRDTTLTLLQQSGTTDDSSVPLNSTDLKELAEYDRC